MATQSKSAKFVEKFVRLSKDKPDRNAAIMELFDLVTEISPQGSFELSPQQEAALRLKPTKAFRKACAFMASEAAISSLLFITTRAPQDPERSLLFTGLLLKMTTIPSFAAQVGTKSTAAVLFEFQNAHLPKALASTQKRTRGSWICVDWWDSVLMYLDLVINLVKGSQHFADEALRLRLVHKLLEALPMQQQPFLAWAGKDELKAVAGVLGKVGMALMELCLHGTSGCPFLETEADFFCGWVDSYLNFVRALSARLRHCMSNAEAKDSTDDMMGPLVRLAVYVESLKHNRARAHPAWPEKVAHAFFAPARLKAFQQSARSLLGSERWGHLGKLVVHQMGGLSLLSEDSGTPCSPEPTDLGAPSFQRAAGILEELKGAAINETRLHLLSQLEQEVKKLYFTQEDTVQLAAGVTSQFAQDFVRQLALRGCFSELANVLEREDLSRGKVSEGPGGLAILILAKLVLPFDEATEAYVDEMAELAPRLLGVAQRAADRLSDELLTCLVDALFACYEMAPDQKWAARLELTDLLIAVSEKSGSGSSPSFASWGYLSDIIRILPEPTPDVKKMIGDSQAAEMDGHQRMDAWKDIVAAIERDVARSKVRWGPKISTEKVLGAVLGTLRAESGCFSNVRGPAFCASKVLLFCCLCAPEADLEMGAVKNVGRVVATLREGYATMAAPFQLPSNEQALITQGASFRAWFGCQQVVAILVRYLDLLLTLPSRDELWDEVACNGGVDFAADVLRTRVAAKAFVNSEAMASALGEARANSAIITNVRMLHAVAETLWKELSQKYGLMKCAYQDCKGVVYETQKNAFRKCGACERVRYCSKVCQTIHWKKEHKGLCER